MSLAIDPLGVVQVLLADGWHDVHGPSFELDAYEFMAGETVLHGGGRSGICATGFRFKEAQRPEGVSPLWIAGPLTSILAVRQIGGA